VAASQATRGGPPPDPPGPGPAPGQRCGRCLPPVAPSPTHVWGVVVPRQPHCFISTVSPSSPSVLVCYYVMVMVCAAGVGGQLLSPLGEELEDDSQSVSSELSQSTSASRAPRAPGGNGNGSGSGHGGAPPAAASFLALLRPVSLPLKPPTTPQSGAPFAQVTPYTSRSSPRHVTLTSVARSAHVPVSHPPRSRAPLSLPPPPPGQAESHRRHPAAPVHAHGSGRCALHGRDPRRTD
jgi:hypothetical protein